MDASYPDLLNRALAMHRAGKLDDAEAAYNALLTQNPRDFHALRLLGTIAGERGCPEAAVRLSELSLAINPRQSTALSNRGLALRELGRYDEALASFENSLLLNPDHAAAQWNRSLSKLLAGDFASGWELYEWRWKTGESNPRDWTQPQWRGDTSVAGSKVLLCAEQGLGDTIQFCRYAELVAARGATVILDVQSSLTSVMSSLDGVAQVVARGDPVPEFEWHCPLASLPLAFRTELHTIPARVPYLRADPQAIARWRDKLGPHRAPRIGLAWSGNPKHQNDRNRSIPLSQLLPLLDCGIEVVSLQTEMRSADAAFLAAAPQVRSIADELADFSDTAAVISLLDLVISVDTSVAHLAGALGKPVWILTPFSPDWRWLLGRADSPWYPTARLFRQPRRGDWPSVIGAVCEELRKPLDYPR
jgi:hypothetical protein